MSSKRKPRTYVITYHSGDTICKRLKDQGGYWMPTAQDTIDAHFKGCDQIFITASAGAFVRAMVKRTKREPRATTIQMGKIDFQAGDTVLALVDMGDGTTEGMWVTEPPAAA